LPRNLADGSGELDTGGAGAHDDEGEPCTPLNGIRNTLGHFDLALASTASMRRRAVSRLTVSIFMHPSESAAIVRAPVIEGSKGRIT